MNISNFKKTNKVFFNKFSTIVSLLISVIISFLIAYLTSPSYLFLILMFISMLILCIMYVYFKVEIFVPIILKESNYSINFSNYITNFSIKTPVLMIDDFFNSKLSLTIELSDLFKKNLEECKYYTVIIEKDKSMEVESTREYVKDNDIEENSRGKKYYYLVQEYTGQKNLDFEFTFSCPNKININRNCKIYLEFGDVHQAIENISLRNLFFDEKFFISEFDIKFK